MKKKYKKNNLNTGNEKIPDNSVSYYSSMLGPDRLSAFLTIMFSLFIIFNAIKFGITFFTEFFHPTKIERPVKILHNHSGSITSVDINHDGSMIASGSQDLTIRLWVPEFDKASSQILVKTKVLREHTDTIYSVSFSPDNKYLASGGSDHHLIIDDVLEAKKFKTLDYHTETIKAVKFSPNGKYLASAGFDKSIILWNTQTWKPDRIIPKFTETRNISEILLDKLKGNQTSSHGHKKFILSLAFSNDSKYLLSAGEEDSIKLWETDTGNFIKNIGPYGKEITSMVFSPDNKYLAINNIDNRIFLLDTSTWQIKKKFTIGTGFSQKRREYATSLCFSPDSKYLAAGISVFNQIDIWNIAKDSLIEKLSGDNNIINALTYSPDGLYLVGGSSGNNLIFWKGIK